MKLEEINEKHSLEEFSCDIGSIDTYLKTRALSENNRFLSKTYVATDNDKVVAFCTLVLHSLKNEQRSLFINKEEMMKIRVPALLIGQLAVHKDHKGKGIGASLIQAVINYAIEVNKLVHFPVIIIDARNDDLIKYYEDNGFTSFPDEKSRLYITLPEIVEALQET